MATQNEAEILIQRIRVGIDLSRRLPRDQAENHLLKALADLAALKAALAIPA